jgi:hypothetical protein
VRQGCQVSRHLDRFRFESFRPADLPHYVNSFAFVVKKIHWQIVAKLKNFIFSFVAEVF